MKILILHLSDIHIKNVNNYSKENIHLIVNAIKPSCSDISRGVIVISGDLSFSGQKNQMVEFEKFVNLLVQELREKYGFSSLEVVLVPGNHDVDYSKGAMSRTDLEEIYNNNLYDKNVPNEISKQKEFYKLANKYKCFTKKEVIDQHIVEYGGKIILFNLINTGIFSSLAEDKGYHYLPLSEVMKIRKQHGADYVFSVMHHPHHWFSDIISNELEKVLYECSDMIFVGHKHYESSVNIDDSKTSVYVLAGGQLSNCGDWNGSEFHACILDLCDRGVSIKKYRLSSKGDVYIEYDKQTDRTLSNNRVDSLGLSILPESLAKIMNIDKHSISDSFTKYFVFPTLEEDVTSGKTSISNTNDIESMEAFLKKLQGVKKIVITGHSDSGKSVLAKSIFRQLSRYKTTIFIDGSSVNSNCEKIVRYAFYEFYGDDKSKYEIFKQADLSDLAIVIDDIDAIEPKRREEFIEYINERFGYVVETCQQEIELDIKNRLRNKRANRDYSIYRIAPFYLHKRRELVTNIINTLSIESDERKENIITALCDSLARQKVLYNWNPDFIVQFTRYYYKNIGESYKNDGDTFGKVFEANIVLLIKPFSSKISVDKILIVLDKIAYGAYINKESPISDETILQIVRKYNDEYDSNIDIREFLNLLIESKILKKSKNNGYMFYETTYLAYFIAREIKRRCIEDGDLDQIKYIIEHSYKRINADILLFVTYITDNLNIIKMLMDLAESSLAVWEAFQLEENAISYLKADATFKIDPVTSDDREKEEEKRIAAEKDEAQYMYSKNDELIFYDDGDEINFFHELIRGIALLTVISRTLPSFEHLMKKEDKERCVDLIYNMPLKIFNAWAMEIDKNCNELLREIKDFHEWEYRKDKINDNKYTDNNALEFLQWETISLLLELMHVAVSNAVRDNTWKFIDGYDFSSKAIYGIEHLMALGKQNKIEQFIQEAGKLNKPNSRNICTSMIKRVAHNVMVTSSCIKYDQIQKMNAKIFNEKLEEKYLLIEKNKNKKKIK